MAETLKTNVIVNERLEETLHSARLQSGLAVFILPKKGFRKKYATFATNYGSIDTSFVPPGHQEPVKVPDGIAHFLEHQLFAEETGDIFDKFARLGASANAYTHFTSTTYLFSTTGDFYPALDLLLEFVSKPYITEATVEKEKGIIEQEVRMYQDTPRWRVFSNLLNALFHNHPIRVDIAGTVESVRSINRDHLLLCYQSFYQPSNMLIFIAADEDPEAVFEHVASYLSDKVVPVAGVKRLYPREPSTVRERHVEEQMSVSEPIFRLGFKEKTTGLTGQTLLRRMLSTELLWDLLLGASSSLFNRLYEKGLLDNTFGFDYIGHPEFGVSILGGQTGDPRRTHSEILKGVLELRRTGVWKEAFPRHKNKAVGSYLQRFDHPESLAYIFNSGYFLGIGLFDYLEVLESLTVDDIEERLEEHVDPDYSAISIVYPVGKRHA